MLKDKRIITWRLATIVKGDSIQRLGRRLWRAEAALARFHKQLRFLWDEMLK
jgi:hypothetical protein